LETFAIDDIARIPALLVVARALPSRLPGVAKAALEPDIRRF
jgi:hypothetical protein